LLALVVLLVAISALLVMDRQFWFGADQLILDSVGTEPANTPGAKSAPNKTNQSKPATAPAAKKRIAPAASAEPQSANSRIVATKRAVLPPLNVEIVAGTAHRPVRSAGSPAQIEIADSNPTAVTNAAEHEGISAGEPRPQTYPLLAQHMNVQGSVVLQAVIGVDGIIEDLHVLSGPPILAAAAQQAVREWRFKPVVQNGQAVETKANIVVNFTIKVVDNSEKTTLAESRYDGLIFTR
jgi:TonB family protein